MTNVCHDVPPVRDPPQADEEIRRELKRRIPDSIRLLRLKTLRLMVKDRLAGNVRMAAA